MKMCMYEVNDKADEQFNSLLMSDDSYIVPRGHYDIMTLTKSMTFSVMMLIPCIIMPQICFYQNKKTATLHGWQ